MHKSITIRGLDDKDAKTDAIKNYVWDKFQKIEKILKTEQQPIYVDMVITIVSPKPAHVVEMRLRAPGYTVVVEKENPELYRAIDEVLDLTWQQITQEKEKRDHKIRKEGFRAKLKKWLKL